MKHFVQTAKKLVQNDTKKWRELVNEFEVYYKNCEHAKFSLQSITKTLIDEEIRTSGLD